VDPAAYENLRSRPQLENSARESTPRHARVPPLRYLDKLPRSLRQGCPIDMPMAVRGAGQAGSATRAAIMGAAWSLKGKAHTFEWPFAAVRPR
jgi:hypothetical protein